MSLPVGESSVVGTSNQQLLFDPVELEAPKHDAGPFRPIHYLGSKLRLVESICQIVHEAGPKGGRVCDLFAGSGTISFALSRNHPVIAVDIQEYSRVICAALLTADRPTSQEVSQVMAGVKSSANLEALSWALAPLLNLEDRYLKDAVAGEPKGLFDIVEHGSIVTEQLGQSRPAHSELGEALRLAVVRLKKVGLDGDPASTVTRYLGGIYYSYRQAIALDCILSTIHQHAYTSRDRFLAAALGAASDTVNTVGRQFAQPIRPRSASGEPKRHLVQKTLRDRSMDVIGSFSTWIERYSSIPKPSRPNEVRRMDFRNALKDEGLRCDVVYADPPYTRDHYSRYYHALETMCLRDNPAVSTAKIGGHTVLSRGLYRVERHQSPFCIKSQALPAFDELCRGVRGKGATLILSYSPFDDENGERPRVTSIEAIESIAKEYFRRVDIVSPGKISHSKLTSTDMTVDTRSEAEKVLVCRN